ncbi:hypothetical protein HRG_014950 [Hirsutella rhossiliensis]
MCRTVVALSAVALSPWNARLKNQLHACNNCTCKVEESKMKQAPAAASSHLSASVHWLWLQGKKALHTRGCFEAWLRPSAVCSRAISHRRQRSPAAIPGSDPRQLYVMTPKSPINETRPLAKRRQPRVVASVIPRLVAACTRLPRAATPTRRASPSEDPHGGASLPKATADAILSSLQPHYVLSCAVPRSPTPSPVHEQLPSLAETWTNGETIAALGLLYHQPIAEVQQPVLYMQSLAPRGVASLHRYGAKGRSANNGHHSRHLKTAASFCPWLANTSRPFRNLGFGASSPTPSPSR